MQSLLDLQVGDPVGAIDVGVELRGQVWTGNTYRSPPILERNWEAVGEDIKGSEKRNVGKADQNLDSNI